ncbi:ABC transporter permease [Oscillochloris sp. ZM17-4]|uniref:ABC transporter permease n=1 Tax=Oscillochloris sp. ZM17-4 TaxID=2866714 RepID=UPI001C73DF16|nr:ABC transporter permease [Oscillochloris sp. ZM17-4]MBX0328073.1 ABC transporter permease [Oscillochloris sp. ZM17-4]
MARDVATSTSPPRWRLLVARQELVILALLLLVSAGLSLLTGNFFAATNLLNLARNVSWFAVAAFGVGMVILIGGIDLSSGAVMALAGLASALLLQLGLPIWLAVPVGLLSGALVGLCNGVLVGMFNTPPFIVTLGMMGVVRGMTFSLSAGRPVRDLPPAFRALGQDDVWVGPLLVPLPLLTMVGVALLVSLLLRSTVLGRYIYTLGRDERALQVAGVRTERIKVVVYTFSGLLAACGGIIMTSWLGVAAPTAAADYELDIIAAAVIGGTSLFGGEGSVFGVVLGALLMQVVRTGMVLLGFPTYLQVGAIGMMIMLVVLIDNFRRRRLSR